MKRLTRSSGDAAINRGRERDQRAMLRSRSRSLKSIASVSTRRDSMESRSKSREKSPTNGKKNFAARAESRKKERSRDGSDSHVSRKAEIARETRTRDTSVDDSEGNETTSAIGSKRKDSKPRAPLNKRKLPSRRSASLSNGHADEVQSPVREISFTREDSDTRHLRPPPKKKRRLSPSELDESTLEAVKDYVTKNKFAETLQDDEFAQFMLRVNRNTTRQADYQLQLLGDSDESDTSLVAGIAESEQDHSIGHDMFKTMVANLRKEGKQPLDSRTLRWIKKASGIRRPPVVSLARQHAIETDTSRMIKTRTTMRRSRAQKKEVGVKYLVKALDELQSELQPPAARLKVPPPKPSVPYTRPVPTQGSKNGSTARKVQAAPKRQTTRQTILLARILQQRQFVSGTTIQYSKNVSITRIVLNGRRVRREQVASWKGEPTRKRKANKENINVSNSLKYMEWHRRQATSLFSDEEPADLLDPDFRKRVNDGRDSSLIQAEVVCRLPLSDALREGLSSVLHPPRLRCSVAEYASLCLKLMSSLSGPARSWSIAEFFYSDIDRPWYSHNKFVEAAATIGISPSARLTTSEWKAVRRQLRPKPRRFSKRFIEAQLEERNKFRHAVRMRQRFPLLDGMKCMPYDVPAVIQTGATVTAYCRRFRIIQRGTVIGYDATKAIYCIQFDDAKFGTEDCPDTEVASHGGARVLIEARASITSPSAYGDASGLPTGSKKASLHELESLPSVAVGSEMQKALSLPNQLNAPRVSNDVLIEAAERDMLIHLLSASESATQRKELLLTALDAANAQQVTNLPFGDVDIGSIGEPDPFVQSHVTWLLANLEETNEAISSTLTYMRPMYHMAHTPSKSHDSNCTQQLVEKGLQWVAADKLPAADASRDWAWRLAEDATRIGHTLSAPSSKPDAVRDSHRGKEMVATAGALLLASSCCKAIAAAPLKTGHHDPSRAVLSVLARELLDFSDDYDQAVSTSPDGGEALHFVQGERTLAITELKGALSLLNTELAIASVVQQES